MRSTRIAIVVSLLASPAHALDLDPATYTNRDLGIRLEAPQGWHITRQTGYPSMLALLLRSGERAQITLSVDRLPRTAAAISDRRRRSSHRAAQPPNVARVGLRVADNKKGLAAVGLRVFRDHLRVQAGRRIWALAAETKDGKLQIRQRYLKHRENLLILTLRCRTARARALTLELDRILSTLKLL